MPSRSRPVLLVLLAALAAVAVAACGGGSSSTSAPASAGTDARQLLRDTFSNGSRLKSGVVDASLAAQAPGAGAIRLRLTGPFASDGEGRLPRFQYTASVQGAGQDVQAGLTWTGKKGFVAFQGVQYEVPAALARQFQAGYEEALKRQKGDKRIDPAALGIDFTRWLRNPRNTGEREVAGVKTIRIAGDADVARALDDVQRLAARARALNVPGAGSAKGLTARERREAIAAVRKLSAEIYTGKDDRILRRLVLHARIADRHSGKTVPLNLDVSFRDVNTDQDIATPSGARPLSELTSKLGGLSGLGLGAQGSGASAKGLDAYADCVQRAGGDRQERQACAALLGP